MVALATKSGLGPTADLLFGIAQKVGKKASPCTPLHPAVRTTGGMRQRHTKASLALRTVCADDASTTARCSAPRRGLMGRLVRQQLFGSSIASYGHRYINRHLSTLRVFDDLARIEWAFQQNVARSPDARIRGTRARHAAVEFDFTKLRDLYGSVEVAIRFIENNGANLRSKSTWI